VTRRKPAPSTLTTKIAQQAFRRVRTKASRLPSGENCGSSTSVRERTTTFRCRPLRSVTTIPGLAAGYSTAEMAQRMGISKETVRNHVKGVLRSLDARSRVEAVAKGRRVGLI
jgi:DNA-binding NarL/FixJ family response regulator